MKFTVDKVELITEENFSYYGIFDTNNNNWYEEQKKFKNDTLKVMYDEKTLQILSINRDVSLLSPTEVGDIVEEIETEENIELTQLLYFVDGKIINLKDYEKIENGKVVFDRQAKIEKIKKELFEIRLEYDVAPFEFELDGETYLQNNRSIDQSNLTRIVVMCQAMRKTSFENWKFYTKDNSDKYVNLSLQKMMEMALIMQNQTTKSMATETLLSHKLDSLTDEELKAYDAKAEYDKAYKEME